MRVTAGPRGAVAVQHRSRRVSCLFPDNRPVRDDEAEVVDVLAVGDETLGQFVEVHLLGDVLHHRRKRLGPPPDDPLHPFLVVAVDPPQLRVRAGAVLFQQEVAA